MLAKSIAASYQKRRTKLDTQIDAKLKSKIEQKKQAHGLKTERTIQENLENDDDQNFTMTM